MHRRNFLKGLGATIALSSVPGSSSFAINPLFATAKREEILVFVFIFNWIIKMNISNIKATD